jgi:hypothetical protein
MAKTSASGAREILCAGLLRVEGRSTTYRFNIACLCLSSIVFNTGLVPSRTAMISLASRSSFRLFDRFSAAARIQTIAWRVR